MSTELSKNNLLELRKPLAIFFWFASFTVLPAGASFVWIVKDGLGPDAVDTNSHGLIAFKRFGSGMMWVLGLYVFPLALIGFALWPWGRKCLYC